MEALVSNRIDMVKNDGLKTDLGERLHEMHLAKTSLEQENRALKEEVDVARKGKIELSTAMKPYRLDQSQSTSPINSSRPSLKQAENSKDFLRSPIQRPSFVLPFSGKLMGDELAKDISVSYDPPNFLASILAFRT